MNKNIIRWWLAILIVSFSGTILAAPKGICTPDNGVFHSTLNFSGYLITANQNRVGTIFNTTVSNGGSYPGRCHCDTGPLDRFSFIYYTARINDALSFAGVHSNLSYYNLNPNLDVGIAIDIRVGMVNAPFEYQPNKPSASYDCGRIAPLNFSSGARAQIYFYIKKPLWES